VSINRVHLTVITGWFVVLGAAFATRVALGTPGSVPETLAWLSVACIPAIILVAVFRGAPTQTIAQVLYETEQTPNLARADAATGHDAAARS
jgi:hypothetical protein